MTTIKRLNCPSIIIIIIIIAGHELGRLNQINQIKINQSNTSNQIKCWFLEERAKPEFPSMFYSAVKIKQLHSY